DGAEDKTPAQAAQAVTEKIIVKGAVHRDLPKVRNSKTFSFTVAGTHGYVTVGEYEDGTPGEVFVNIAKQGSTLRGVMDAFAISISHGLQYGVPLKAYVRSFVATSFAPAGITDDPEIRTASSLVDYIARRLALTYLSFDDRLELGLASIDDMPDEQISLLGAVADTTNQPIQENPAPIQLEAKPEAPTAVKPKTVATKVEAKPETSAKIDQSAPLCYNCGNQTQKAGSCYVCSSCGSTTGCS